MSLYTLLFFLSCSRNSESSFAYPSSQKEDTSAAYSEPEDIDPQEPSTSCIDGFVPIPVENPIYCIMQCEALVTDTGPISGIGELPSSNVSYYDAQEFCASIDHTIPIGLPNIDEWMDAGDGIVGVGGTSYPWGNEFHAGECVLPYEENTWSSHQTCGYLDTCSSVFGVYDQIGNLWEWVDSGLYTDIDSWMQHQEEQGTSFTIVNGVLHTNKETLQGLHPFVVGLSQANIDITDGMIWIRLTQPFRQDLPGVGYLKSSDMSIPTSVDFLPISLSWDEERQNAQIVVDEHRNGEPIPAKVGEHITPVLIHDWTRSFGGMFLTSMAVSGFGVCTPYPKDRYNNHFVIAQPMRYNVLFSSTTKKEVYHVDTSIFVLQ